MRRAALIAALVAVAAGCGSDDGAARSGGAAAKVNRFDAGRALRLARLQVSYGQRPAGSEALRRLAERLRIRLPRGRFEDVPGHPGLRNVVGRLPGRAPAIVLGAHYDTEVEPPGFVGANDGAAGTAAVIEAARALERIERPARAPALRFVLFDGEEEPRQTDDFYRDALRGSKAYVAAHRDEIRSLLLLDYVGNKGLRLPREGTSTLDLWARVRGAARRVGKGSYFPDEVGSGVIDDHTPFLRAGIPAVDFIDFTYEYRDTTADTLDKLSAASLDAVGETVVEILRR